MAAYGHDFRSLRAWRGSQYQAFEELCYQLRDPTPDRLSAPVNPRAAVYSTLPRICERTLTARCGVRFRLWIEREAGR